MRSDGYRGEFWQLSSSACPAYGLTDLGCAAAQMPVLDGMGAIRLLRQMESQGKICGHIPTLAVTANAREEQIAAMEDAGFDGIVSDTPRRLRPSRSETRRMD